MSLDTCVLVCDLLSILYTPHISILHIIISSVACGREYTLVSTHPYIGLTEAETLKLAEEKRVREEEEKERQVALEQTEKDELKRLGKEEAETKKIEFLTSRRLCTFDSSCPGFTYDTNQPSICRECGFSVVYHTIVVEDDT